MPLCKDCKHCKEIILSYCEHPNIGINHYDGLPKAAHCITTRNSEGLCGPNATWFDPKPSLLQRLTNFFNPAPNL